MGASSAGATTLVGVDTGGTFTDFVLIQDGAVRIHKEVSTPDDPSRAILNGLTALGVQGSRLTMIHGSTVATNAVLEREGAHVGLITTAGFADVLEIGRQTRPRIYGFEMRREPPLVPARLRLEVNERLDEQGRALTPLDPASVTEALATLRRERVESVAICLLFSFANPEHEHAIAEQARAAGLYVSASADVLPEFREYERASTVTLNAYVGPIIDRYLGQLERGLPPDTPLRVMQSNGGSISAATARREAARTLLSGPAAGVVGAAFMAEASGFDEIISFDMGGTSTDVAHVAGAIAQTSEGSIGGYPMRLPMIDIHTVGAGGGSIAWFDTGGALRVGPASAGANPGPAAYGRGGTEPTVTDANIVLGRLIPEQVLGGALAIDPAAARESVAKIARQLALTPEEAALGMLRIVNAHMEGAIRVISVQRGYDPRACALVAFGGAGPLHACELAASLRIPRVLIPPVAGVLSALGMLAADIIKDYVRTIMLPLAGSDDVIAATLARLVEQGRRDLSEEDCADERIIIERALDLRYMGQSYELTVPFDEGTDMASAFHRAHAQRFGYSDEREPVQVVNVRVKARGRVDPPRLPRHADDVMAARAERTEWRRVAFSGADGKLIWHDTPVYLRERLTPGAALAGPAIIAQYDTTSVLPPGWSATVDATGAIVAHRSVNDSMPDSAEDCADYSVD
ncbi:MAG TPA: hydantoinase/oxoprolinase family protein [Ktedonobacterales bacterium]|jgi:N-methylhydantoinase A|nr:hydantoinase/oxoprolinase family protein [Ktedonobacterales bacterium]